MIFLLGKPSGEDLCRYLNAFSRHQFNRKQLSDLRKLIEKMHIEDQAKVSLLPSWMDSNKTAIGTQLSYRNASADRLFYRTILLSAAEFNATEEKLEEVVERIQEVEGELQSIGWETKDVKNIIDELLTGAKDLKGYSRSQIETLQSFRADLLEFSDSITLQMPLATGEEYSKTATKKGEVDGGEKNIPEVCFNSVLERLNTTSLTEYSKGLSPNLTNFEIMAKVLRFMIEESPKSSQERHHHQNFTSDSKFDFDEENYSQSEDQLYYDDENEMLMDDHFSWNKNDANETKNEEKNFVFFVPLSEKPRTKFSKKPHKSKTKPTIAEEDLKHNY